MSLDIHMDMGRARHPASHMRRPSGRPYRRADPRKGTGLRIRGKANHCTSRRMDPRRNPHSAH
eukprot:3049990-Heterocapsa_arctica.AAC.1